ncbi:hypothetical protein Tco_0198945 [Tanacetum coccineum]
MSENNSRNNNNNVKDNVFNDNINNNITNNVNNVVNNEDLSQLLVSRGGSHVTNIPQLDVKEFSNWKDTFLVYLDELEPFLLEILENGHHEEPSETRDTKIAALRLKINAFKALGAEKVQQTYTRLKILLNDLENKDVKIPQAEGSNSDIEEDTRSSQEFLADLNQEYHDRALLANQNRFYKRHFQKDYPNTKTSLPSNPSLNKFQNKTKFQTNSSSSHQNNKTTDNDQKDYRARYKSVKAKLTLLTQNIASSKQKNDKGLVAESYDWDAESLSSRDEGTTTVKAFRAIFEDEPSVGKSYSRSGQWVEITMKKVYKLLSMNDGDERKHVLDYTMVDLYYVED